MSFLHTPTPATSTVPRDRPAHRVHVKPAGPGLAHDSSTTHAERLPVETALEASPAHHSRAGASPTSEHQDEGDRERAALATVFGVQEYTESVTFWKRLHEEECSNHKPLPTPPSPTKKKKGGPQYHHQRHRSLAAPEQQTATAPASHAHDLLSLPDIPTVSKFNDLLVDDEHGVDFLLPANPSSVLLHSLSPANIEARSVAGSSVHSSTAGAPAVASSSSTTTSGSAPEPTVAPPRLFIGYPPSIFDMLKSDDDERIIVWGPGGADRTTSSSASGHLLHSQPAAAAGGLHDTASPPTKRPPSSLQGFSTNTTTKGSLPSGTSPNKRRSSKLVNSARMSAQSLLVDSFHRLSRQKSLPARIRPRASKQQLQGADQAPPPSAPPPLLKRASFTLKNRHSAEELHPLPIPADPQQRHQQHIIVAASVEKLVEKLTNSLDYALMTDFFLTFRTFISPTQLCKLLVLRFRWALESDDDDRCVVRVRTFVVMRHWLLNYFVHDFVHCRELRVVLASFLNSLAQHPRVRQSARDQRIVNGLKRVVRRLKYVHFEQGRVTTEAHPVVMDSTPQDESGFRTGVDRSSALCGDDDDDGSLGSDLTPGNSEAGGEDLALQVEDGVHPAWSEEHAMARLQYERRRREEEEERTRAEFFSSSDGVSVPSLHSDVVSTCASSSEPTTPMDSIDSRILSDKAAQHTPPAAAKRPPGPSGLVALHDLSPKLPATTPGGSRRQYIPATIIHDVSVEPQEELIEKTVRRIPSNRWCKATPEDEKPVFNKEQFDLDARKHKQQSVSTPTSPTTEIATGLSRRLSKKSIERRKSEKNLREHTTQSAASSAASSVVSTPHMSSSASAPADTSDIPEMPPLPAAALNAKLLVAKTALASFEALPYAMTAPVTASPSTEAKQSKRRLPRKFSKLFKQSSTTSDANKPLPQLPSNSTPVPNTKTSSSAVSSTSASSSDTATARAEPAADVSKISSSSSNSSSSGGGGGGLALLSQLAAELRGEDDNDDTATLRRDSLDKQARAPRRHGPIYLSHLQPTGFESETAVYIEEAEESDNDDGQSTRTATATNLTRGMSLLSNAPNHIRTMSLIVEPADDRYASLMVSPDEPSVQPSTPVSPVVAPAATTTTISSSSTPATVTTQPSSKQQQHSFILSYHSSRIVEQLCLIEREVLFGVQWEELVDCRWRDGIAPSGGVQRLIQRFNAVCQWVASEIVTIDTVDGRAEIIRKFIRLAQKCKLYANFATLLQILLGLQSPAVTRLSATWARVSASDMRLLDQLIEFTSPIKNWKSMRDSMAVAAEEHGNRADDNGATTRQDGPTMGGCIPFLGIYLSDLIFNAELPPYIEPCRRKNSCDSLVLQQPLVNFHKHRTTATIIKRVLTFQNLARRYPFTPDAELYRLCLDIPSIDLDTIRKMSMAIEP